MKKYFISYGLIAIVSVVLLSLYLRSTYQYRFPFSNWISGANQLDTSKWRLYKNEKMKFSMQYPDEVEITDRILVDDSNKRSFFTIYRFNSSNNNAKEFGIIGVDMSGKSNFSTMEKNTLVGDPDDKNKPRITRRESINADWVKGTLLVAQYDTKKDTYDTYQSIGFSTRNRFYFIYYLGTKATYAKHTEIIKGMAKSMKFLP